MVTVLRVMVAPKQVNTGYDAQFPDLGEPEHGHQLPLSILDSQWLPPSHVSLFSCHSNQLGVGR